MRKVVHTVPAAALLGAVLVIGAAPASAQVARPQSGLVGALSGENARPLATEVQYRRWHRRHYGWRHHRHHRGWGPGLGVGLATGAIIGGAIAAQSQARANSAIEYCMRRFRSFDPASGTYLGFDGRRHPCP
jgi:hypothetical protein